MFSALLKLKGSEEFVWEERHQEAFEAIKRNLARPPATEERESSTAVHLSGRESYVKRTNDDERGEEEEASGSRHPFRSFSITQTRQMVSGDITS